MKKAHIIFLICIFISGCDGTVTYYNFKNESDHLIYLYPQGSYYKTLQYAVTPNSWLQLTEIGECSEIVDLGVIAGYRFNQEGHNYFKLTSFFYRALEGDFIYSNNRKLYAYEKGIGSKVEVVESDCYPPLQ